MVKLDKINKMKLKRTTEDVVSMMNKEIRMMEFDAMFVIYYTVVFVGAVFACHLFTSFSRIIDPRILYTFLIAFLTLIIGRFILQRK